MGRNCKTEDTTGSIGGRLFLIFLNSVVDGIYFSLTTAINGLSL